MSTEPQVDRPVMPPEIPPVERQVVFDMIRRCLPALPILVLAGAAIWGVPGALSAAFAIGLVLLNFMLAATLLAAGARISLAMFALAAMGGFVLRLGLITVAVLAVKDHWWVELVPLGFTLVLTHLGLLVWEARHVSTSLAFPGLKPQKG